MDADAIIEGLAGLVDTGYGRVYVEYGGFSDSRTVLFHEGHWCYDDEKHNYYFQCESLKDALECMVNPPTEDQWEDNLTYRSRGGPEQVDDQPARRDEI